MDSSSGDLQHFAGSDSLHRRQQGRHAAWRQLYSQPTTARSSPSPRATPTDHAAHTRSLPIEDRQQQQNEPSPLPHDFAPSVYRGSLVALLREQSLPEREIDLFGGRGASEQLMRRSSDAEEISSSLEYQGGSSNTNNNTGSTGPLIHDQTMDDTSSQASSSSLAPVATRQQRARAAATTAKRKIASAAAGSAPEKRSRYLREVDRRSIIHRIDRGEKQVALAKEFGVTRAAISHINKKRVEILTRSTRADVHSGARHPKRGPHAASAATLPAVAAASKTEHARPGGIQPSVLELRSAAMALLLTTLRQRETASRDFQICTDRAFRLLLEEALARVATRPIDVVTPSDYVCEGIVANKPSCGVSISEDGFALLQVFRSIQPASPAGFITLNATAVHEGVSSEPTLQKVCVPADVRVFDVFLMEATCATGAGACVSIQALLDFGVQESSIHFVCLLASAFGVSEICRRFPAVHIVTGAIDPEVSDDGLTVYPGVGSFSERYFDSTLVHFTSLGGSADL